MGEFDLIRRYFAQPAAQLWGGAVAPPSLVLGIGDDCALLAPEPGQQLAISSDMLVEGRHFFADVDPATLGHKALAVNLSDLAAMGATPLGFTLALALPQADEAWLAAFSRGLLALAQQHRCPLVGGDTTRGPLNLCITVFGQVPAGQALRRSGAQLGDDIYISGTVGDARLALEALLGHTTLPADVLQRTRQRLECPTPRLALGQALRGIATAAADVSDGLLGDLGHILTASGVGAELYPETLLQSAAVSDAVRQQPLELAWTCALAGGDDYELVFTAPPTARAAVQFATERAHTAATRIGRVAAGRGVLLLGADGHALPPDQMPILRGFDHFS
ncbi:thiamine-phosphate kinase [Macromonas bipunctata]|uniref:thiamine-phosphate kinase n=1 Tax=Macromonas bipunctata TaxID=183670 RepID=UPI000C335441|nr:thiamine-phosphate kinase [Macromonas bipunctata]